MLASQLMDMRAMLHSQGVIFAYSGYVTEPVLSGVGEALKQKLTIDDADTKSSRPSGWNSAPSSPFISASASTPAIARSAISAAKTAWTTPLSAAP
jgi:hypothetical protein